MGGAGALACSAVSGVDSAEVANAVSAQATIIQDMISQLARNNTPDFANQKHWEKRMQSFLFLKVQG
jgi:hypothetical protein